MLSNSRIPYSVHTTTCQTKPRGCAFLFDRHPSLLGLANVSPNGHSCSHVRAQPVSDQIPTSRKWRRRRCHFFRDVASALLSHWARPEKLPCLASFAWMDAVVCLSCCPSRFFQPTQCAILADTKRGMLKGPVSTDCCFSGCTVGRARGSSPWLLGTVPPLLALYVPAATGLEL